MSNQSNVYTNIVSRAWRDPDFKARLLADPKAVLAEAGVLVADDVRIQVHVDTDAVVNLILPTSPAGESISEQELDQIAGGTLVTARTCFPC